MASQFDLPYYAPGETTEELVKQGRLTPGGSYSGVPALPLGQVASNLSSALRGDLPPDVQNLLAQHAAELGVSSGTSGSEFNKFRSLRDLGLTSLSRQDEATRMLLPFFHNQQQQQFQENESYQNRSAALQRGNPFMPENRPPIYQPPTRGNPTGNPAGHPATGSDSDLNSIIAELGQKYGPGGAGAGMSPMGSGTIPSYGGSWNAGPLESGKGSFFAGDPSELSAEELFAYGLDSAPSYTDPLQGVFTGDVSGYDAEDSYA